MIKYLQKIRLLFRLARLHFLILGFLLYILGYLIAIQTGIQHNLTKFLFGYVVFGTAHLSVSFSNNYYDQQADKKSSQTPFSGGTKILMKYPEMQKITIQTAIVLLLISAITNIIFTIHYSYSIWFPIFVVLGGLLGYFYTAIPIKLSYRGWGEIATILGVGLFMTGMGYFVAKGQLDTNFLLFLLPLSAYGLFFIITVELPDKECDTLANKKTLVVKLGRKNAKKLAFLATLIVTIYCVTIDFQKIGNTTFNWKALMAFSMIPLSSSIISLQKKANDQKSLTKQVMLNITGLTIFVILSILHLLLQNI